LTIVEAWPTQIGVGIGVSVGLDIPDTACVHRVVPGVGASALALYEWARR
jgi:hypothetical protein